MLSKDSKSASNHRFEALYRTNRKVTIRYKDRQAALIYKDQYVRNEVTTYIIDYAPIAANLEALLMLIAAYAEITRRLLPLFKY